MQPSWHHPYQRQRRYLIWVLLLLVALLLWMLSSLDLIPGAWASVLNAVFTSLGTIFALLQWQAQWTPEGSCAPVLSSSEKPSLREQFVQSRANKREGAILVCTSRKWHGRTLYLLSGLQETTGPLLAAASVVERRITGERQFLCSFPVVPPGHYTLIARSRRQRSQITVYPGHLSEIDWR